MVNIVRSTVRYPVPLTLIYIYKYIPIIYMYLEIPCQIT